MTRLTLALALILTAGHAHAFISVPTMPTLWPHGASAAPAPVISAPQPGGEATGAARR